LPASARSSLLASVVLPARSETGTTAITVLCLPTATLRVRFRASGSAPCPATAAQLPWVLAVKPLPPSSEALWMLAPSMQRRRGSCSSSFSFRDSLPSMVILAATSSSTPWPLASAARLVLTWYCARPPGTL